MVIGLGVDIVSVQEMTRNIDDVEGFLTEVFTTDEIAECRGRPNSYECFAARFAAKEAFMKAIGTGWSDEIDFQCISVKSDGSSVPELVLNKAVQNFLMPRIPYSIFLTLTHVPEYACAVVVLDR
jgi:holo-[acyl-carrier protein] synthase